MKKLLIVVDMQNDFVDGSLGTKEAEGIVAHVKAKVEQYQEQGDAVTFTILHIQKRIWIHRKEGNFQ